MRFRTGLIAAMLASLGGSAVSAETIGMAIDLPTGSVITLSIDKTTTKTEDGASTSIRAAVRYRQALTPTKTGYIVRQTFIDFNSPDLAGASAADLEQARKMAAAAGKVTFETDDALTPLRVPDWSAYTTQLLAAMGEAGAPAAVLGSMRQMYAGMGPEGAATLLTEQNIVAAVQGIQLDTSKPLVSEGQITSPLGGPPIKASASVILLSMNKAAGTASIRTVEALDPQSASANIKAILPQFMAQMAPSAPKLTDADLAAAKIERSTECLYQIDLKTGLTRKADCTKTQGVSGIGDRSAVKVDHYVISQTLAER